MKTHTFKRIFFPALLIFVGVPLLLYATGDFARRSTLKEAISMVTILAFSLMVAQFFLSRTIRAVEQDFKMSAVIKAHKGIGAVFTAVLLLHPFLIVVPRYFESGQSPADAFTIMMMNFGNPGVLMGHIAYLLMILIALTSMFRKKLPLDYKQWRVLHGVLSIGFVVTALLHVLKLGRHMDTAFSVYFIAITAAGIVLLLNVYRPKFSKRGLINE
jgi:predicted ferric reductase